MRNMSVQNIVNSAIRPLKEFNSAMPATFAAPLALALPYLLKNRTK